MVGEGVGGHMWVATCGVRKQRDEQGVWLYILFLLFSLGL